MRKNDFPEKWKEGLVALSRCIAEGFLSGRSPLIPGTVGSLPGIVLWFLIPDGIFYWVVWCTLFVGSLRGIDEVVRETGHQDPPSVVIDEILGILLAGAFLPRDLKTGITIFILFRIFDILKPWPASVADKKEGSFYIILDDLIAGIYAHIAHVVIVAKFIFPHGG